MHTMTFITAAETVAEYRKRIREWERQVKYERSIVCSVPPKRIAVSEITAATDDRWEPG